jgi:hypothetical protein
MPPSHLFDYDRSAPLDLETATSREDGGVVTQDVAYASPRGGKVPAYLVEPVGGRPPPRPRTNSATPGRPGRIEGVRGRRGPSAARRAER